MNITYKIGKALLNCEVLSIMTGFRRLAVTNLPRELSRCIEKPFDIEVSKKNVKFKSKDGDTGYYFEYRLLFTEKNKPGIDKLIAYISEVDKKKFDFQSKCGAKILHPKGLVETKEKEPANPSPFIQTSLFGI